ncbi:tetratricopeptide repeat protein [Paucibacter sp. AS339]|uniref:tetratricopeptide repeat protein n=1 Tax=Paucibacter hankyongi TaxID=3133434 RepID=UPI0030AB8F5E
MPNKVAEFLRFSAADPVAMQRDIAEMRLKLAVALQGGDSLAIVDAAADLGSLLTSARMELEAVDLLEQQRPQAERHVADEPAGWFWNAYATALQYSGRRDQAEAFFIQAIELAKQNGWRRLEALASHHWGRSLAEQGRLVEARACFSNALAIREERKDEPGQASSRRALLALETWQAGAAAVSVQKSR